MSKVPLALLATVVIGCTAGEAPPSPGTYTIQFPSTAAAVATDTVQVLLFDLPTTDADRMAFCETLIQARKRKDPQKATVQNPAVNICELAQGRRPISVPYGERAVLAIAQRRGIDFMVGCSIQTFGQGDAPLPIAMSLVDVGNSVPDTTCSTVSDFCELKCPAQ